MRRTRNRNLGALAAVAAGDPLGETERPSAKLTPPVNKTGMNHGVNAV